MNTETVKKFIEYHLEITSNEYIGQYTKGLITMAFQCEAITYEEMRNYEKQIKEKEKAYRGKHQ